MVLIDQYGAMTRCEECAYAMAENTVHDIHLLFHEDSRHNSGLHVQTSFIPCLRDLGSFTGGRVVDAIPEVVADWVGSSAGRSGIGSVAGGSLVGRSGIGSVAVCSGISVVAEDEITEELVVSTVVQSYPCRLWLFASGCPGG